MAISMGLGTIVGLASGYWGGWKDEVIMRINDVFLSIPWLVLMIVIAAVLGRQNLMSVILVIGLTGWSTTARIVRSQVLSLKSRQFVERAKAVGAGEWHIIKKHIFPNVVPLVFANAILTIAIAILSESTLSFLDLGPKDVETWGRILEDAYATHVELTGPYPFIHDARPVHRGRRARVHVHRLRDGRGPEPEAQETMIRESGRRKPFSQTTATF